MKPILIISLALKKRAITTLITVNYSLLTTLCTLITIHCSAQLEGQAKIDSLLKELPLQKEDSNKVRLMNHLSWEYSYNDPDKGIKYGKQALVLATKLDWKEGIARLTNTVGANYEVKGDYSKALEYYHKAQKISEEIGNIGSVAKNISCIGDVYQYESNYTKALEYYLRALKISEEIGQKQLVAKNTVGIGNVYSRQGNYPKALEYYFKCLKTFEETGDRGMVARSTGSIGSVYCEIGDYPKALEYYLKALKVFEEVGNNEDVATITCHIGAVYGYERNFPKALEYFFKALKVSEKMGNNRLTTVIAGNIGGVYSGLYNFRQAVAWHFEALQGAEAIGDRSGEAFALSHIGRDYIGIVTHSAGSVNVIKTGELQAAPYQPATLPAGHAGLIPEGRVALLHKALEYLNKAVAMNKDIGDLNQLKDSYLHLSAADSLLGDYKGALEARDNYHAIKDSLFSQENKEEILKMGIKNEYERQRLTDSLKVAEKQKIAKINLQKQKNYTYLGVAGIFLLAGFSFFIVKERGKSETARKQSDGLLLNILPEEVANELKITGTTTAKHFDNVTVLFTDFVNFTQASESMGAQNLIDELHTCFKKFDEISERYNIEKIKTIGDAYLAVAGLPTADPEHSLHVVSAAKEITEFMSDRLAKLGGERTFEVRVGIHSGSVVAGVVGLKKFAYDIWGDTVNTAARMEQNSEAGKINISQTTYELVKDKFTCKYRGEVDAKGKGMMKMYFVS